MRKCWFWVSFLLLIGCGAAPEGPTQVPPPLVLPSPQPVPPTFTPGPVQAFPSPTPAPTREPQATAVSDTPIPFENTVVELRYQIPAINLDRRLQGNIASQIILIDETTGQGQQRNNQAAVLLQLQQTLKDLELAPVPEGCDRCVQFSFELPLADISASGWLQDVTLLSSLDNFMTLTLGPHFPPDTVVGLRRNISQYAPAQSLALLPDGRLWVWQSNQDMIPEAQAGDSTWMQLIDDLDVTQLANLYQADCQGSPIEILFIGGDETVEVGIVCPEYALPAALLPLYTQLDSVMQAVITNNIERPPFGFPLTALIDFERIDGAQLTIYADGTAVALDNNNAVFSSTLGVTQIVSLTTRLIDSGELATGLQSFGDDVPQDNISRLLVRGETDVFDAMWAEGDETAVLTELNTLLQTLLNPADDLQITPTPSPIP
ncbi:MAG: hypothetical protein KC419_02640 [Anaerolineales bacterium]|nr:hypothetical protein [Anaerolineales bacterium]